MELRVLNTEEQLLQVRDSWTKLYERMTDATPFQSWEWNYSWWISHPEGELFVLEAYETDRNKRIVGFAPLVIINNKIEFIGSVHFDYGMFVLNENKIAAFSFLFEYLVKYSKSHHLNYHLRNIPIWAAQYSLFKEVCNKNDCFRELVDTASVNLQEYHSYKNYLETISRSVRRKSIKPCDKAGIEFKIEPFSEELWQEVSRIYINRQSERIGVSTLDWAKEIVKSLCKDNIIKVSTLTLNNKRIAFLVFFESKNRIYSWLTAFERTDDFGLGHFLKYCLFSYAFENKINKVDLMRGAYNYKKQWNCDVSYNYELVSFRNRLSKRFYIIRNLLRKPLRDFVYNHKGIKSIYYKLSK